MQKGLFGMNLSRNYLIYLLSAGLAAAGAYIAYYQLGGGQYQVVETGKIRYTIAGKLYEGKYNAHEAERLFGEMRDLVAHKKWEGDLVEVAYLAGEGSQFFGVLIKGTEPQIDSAYQIREIKASAALTVQLAMHWLVRPGREKVQAMIQAYAQAHGMELEDYTLQRYLPDNSVLIEAFVKEQRQF